MATSSLTLYSSNAASAAFVLVSSSVDNTVWKVANRSLSTPLSLQFTRKYQSGNKNDILKVVFKQIERNATTAQLATFQASLEISVPKDQSILTPAVCAGVIGYLSSLLDDSTALQATSANRTAIVDGRDV